MTVTRLKCSKCREILVDFKKKKTNATIYREIDIKVNDSTDFNFNKTELEIKEYIMCRNCGHRISLSKLRNKPYFEDLIKIIKGGG
jgi:DNA-directed RNA polymerase subunit RPC12/RpoP